MIEWMTLLDRAPWVIGGVIIGYVWGKTSHNTKEIKRMRSNPKPKREMDDRGSFNINNALMILVVIVVAWSSFSSARTSSQVAAQNDRIESVSNCTSRVLFQAIDALNQRTVYVGDQAVANVDLQKSQLKLLTKGLNPSSTEAEREEAFQTYIEDLQAFVAAVNTQQNTQDSNPFPTPSQYAQCLEAARNGGGSSSSE